MGRNFALASGRQGGRAGGNDVCIDAVVGAKGNRTPDLSHVVGVLCH